MIPPVVVVVVVVGGGGERVQLSAYYNIPYKREPAVSHGFRMSLFESSCQ